MAQSRSTPVIVEIGEGWENALAAGVDDAVARLSEGMDRVTVSTTPILASTSLYPTSGRRRYGTGTHGLLVTVTEAA